MNRMREPGSRVFFAHFVGFICQPLFQAGRVTEDIRQFIRSRQAQGAREDHKVRRTISERALGNFSQPRRRIGFEKMSTTINRMHWLAPASAYGLRSEEHTSELQSHLNLVCRLLLEKKNNIRL